MKKSILTLILICTIIIQGCDNNDCGECFTPPRSFEFEIIDKKSGENLFTNGTFKSNEIKITDKLNNNKPVQFSFISGENVNLIQINSIGWKTEIVNLKIDISNSHIFNFYVDTERKKGDCCSYNKYNKISVKDSDFKLDTKTGVYKIFKQ